MFTDKQLEGAPSIQFVDWINSIEEEIVRASQDIGHYRYHDMYEEADDEIIQLLIKCWNAKRCPYA